MARETLYQAVDRAEMVARIGRLTPETERRWGRMDVNQMLCHLGDAFRGTLRDFPMTAGGSWFDHRIRKRFALSSIPFPRGRIQAPREVDAEGDGTRPVSFEADRAALLTLLERFVQLPPSHDFPPHPVLGPLTFAEFGRFHWRHMDHHLTQFGV